MQIDSGPKAVRHHSVRGATIVAQPARPAFVVDRSPVDQHVRRSPAEWKPALPKDVHVSKMTEAVGIDELALRTGRTPASLLRSAEKGVAPIGSVDGKAVTLEALVNIMKPKRRKQ